MHRHLIHSAFCNFVSSLMLQKNLIWVRWLTLCNSDTTKKMDSTFIVSYNLMRRSSLLHDLGNLTIGGPRGTPFEKESTCSQYLTYLRWLGIDTCIWKQSQGCNHFKKNNLKICNEKELSLLYEVCLPSQLQETN